MNAPLPLPWPSWHKSTQEAIRISLRCGNHQLARMVRQQHDFKRAISHFPMATGDLVTLYNAADSVSKAINEEAAMRFAYGIVWKGVAA